MNIERIWDLNSFLNEAKVTKDPEFEAFRKRLETIFKKTADYYKNAMKDFGDDPEIAGAIKVDMQDYERLTRLAKSASKEQILSAWKGLDTAPMETVFDVMSSKDEKDFMKFMK